MPLQHRPVASWWRVSTASVAMCTCTRVSHNLCMSHGLLLSFMWVMMHWHTCKSLLMTLRESCRIVGWMPFQAAEVNMSKSKYNIMQGKWKMSYEYLIRWHDSFKPGVSWKKLVTHVQCCVMWSHECYVNGVIVWAACAIKVHSERWTRFTQTPFDISLFFRA